MVQHPLVMKVFGPILGASSSGSFAANRLLPGAPGQEPHIDYPYWDLHDQGEFPAGINAGFHMNCQSLISLHEFTAENGATAVVPGSQTRGVYPSAEAFADEHIQLSCPPGSLLLFVGMIWHCSMPNNSSGERTSVLGQYLPKFVKPMEALDRSVKADVLDRHPGTSPASGCRSSLSRASRGSRCRQCRGPHGLTCPHILFRER